MRDLIALFRSLAFALVFYTVSIFICAFGVAAIPFSDRLMRRTARVWAQFHYFCAKWLLGITVEIKGTFRNEPVLYAFKHESVFETIELLRYFDNPVVVAKRELASIPLWGTIAANYGLIFVDREGGAAALRTMMKALRSFTDAGRPIIIFPEGTSVPHGSHPPLQSGFAGLYKLFGLPVIPVALDSGRFAPRHGLIRHSGTLTVQICPEIPAGLDRQSVEEQVYAAINLLNQPQSAAPKL